MRDDASHSDTVNIGPQQRRLRGAAGWGTLALAIIVAALVPQRQVGWAILVFLLCLTAASLVLEARRGVCPVTAERGRRNLDAMLSIGGTPIEDPSLRKALQRVGRGVTRDGAIAGVIAAAVLLAVPI